MINLHKRESKWFLNINRESEGTSLNIFYCPKHDCRIRYKFYQSEHFLLLYKQYTCTAEHKYIHGMGVVIIHVQELTVILNIQDDGNGSNKYTECGYQNAYMYSCPPHEIHVHW